LLIVHVVTARKGMVRRMGLLVHTNNTDLPRRLEVGVGDRVLHDHHELHLKQKKNSNENATVIRDLTATGDVRRSVRKEEARRCCAEPPLTCTAGWKRWLSQRIFRKLGGDFSTRKGADVSHLLRQRTIGQCRGGPGEGQSRQGKFPRELNLLKG